MYFLKMCACLLGIAVISESLPVYRTEIGNVMKNNKLNDLSYQFVTEHGNIIAKRSIHHGIVNGHLCPIGTVKLYGSGYCVPCKGYVIIILHYLWLD